ncbi:MAG: hypothetical protein RLZZ352_2378 [Pseudomonadota bacterium]
MNAGLIDREHALKAALLTVLAAENLVLIGPPGTAKSMVSRRVAQHIQTTHGSHPPNDGSGSYFEYLLTKFSTPEEIFGPLSISELKADRFRRNTAGYLPTAEIAFLDEIFKSSSSILNSLLTILNERVFHNGNQPQHVPLRSLISASNELPNGQEELSALYDRFLMRIFVGPVREEHLHRLFDAPGAAHQPTLQLTAQDFQAMDAAAQQVRMPPEVGEAIRGIWAAHKEAFKEDRREYLSDRRLVKLLKLLRVSAATNHRTEVDLSDAMLLQHCLWNHPDNMDKVREIVITTLQKHSAMVPVDDEDTALDVYVLGSDGKQLVQQPRQKQKTAKKGSQLVKVSSSRQLAASGTALSVSPMRTLPPTKTRTKGFMGSGTAQDPIRIANAEDLISLDDTEIGLAGFYFVQTADIDCSGFTHWPSFAFKGHYNGRGKIISKLHRLFREIQAPSSVTDLQLEADLLAQTVGEEGSKLDTQISIQRCQVTTRGSLVGGNANNTQITNCQVTKGWLVEGNAANSQITGCQVTGGGLVGGNVESTQITDCQVTWDNLKEISYSFFVVLGRLVGGNATNTQITDCQVTNGSLVGGDTKSSKITGCQVMDGESLVLGGVNQTHISDCAVLAGCTYHIGNPNDKGRFGLITPFLRNGSIVERCFVGGSFSDTYSTSFFGGIVGECESGTIRHCAAGSLRVNLRSTSSSGYNEHCSRIAHQCSSAILRNNASIDTNRGEDNPNGKDGKTIAAARFNQRFFEGSLGWDFDTVWQWDAANNRPALRFGANASQAAEPAANNTTAANGTPLEDLLTRQVQANIWL